MLTALAAALAGAPAARAGTYAVSACNAPGGGGVNASWHLEYAGGASGVDFSPTPTGACTGTNGAVVHTSATLHNLGVGARAAWTFRAPAGDVVTHVRLWRFAQARRGWAAAGRAGTAITGGTALERCVGTGTAFCSLGAPGFSLTSRDDFKVAGLPVVSWGVECATSPPCATSTSGSVNAGLDLQGARVTVSDPTPPALAAGGDLLAGGWRRSGQPVVVGATDASGVRSLSLLIDGAARGAVTERCDSRLPAPCPGTAAATFSAGALADGSHTVTVEATDTAGNVARTDRAVLVDGSPPQAALVSVSGRRLTVAVSDAVSGVTGGQLFVRDRPSAPWRGLPTTLSRGRLTATTDRAARGLGLRVRAADAAANVLDSTVTAVSLAARISGLRDGHTVRHGRVAVPYGHSVALSGRLTTTDGVPLARQPIAVSALVHRLGARRSGLATTRTDAHGRFSLRVPAGPSRALTVSYPGAAGLLRSTRYAALRVEAWSSIHAAPRLLFGHGRVRFSGRLGLRGAHVPQSGKLVDVQAHDAGRWRTFATARARGRHGTWRAAYDFSGRPGRFPVRVRIRRESTFPYELGYSRAVIVIVR